MLTHLDYKIVCGNSLLKAHEQLSFETQPLIKKFEELKPLYFNASQKGEKKRYKEQINDILENFSKGKLFDFHIFFSEVFGQNKGFDVIIGNPPYVSSKGGISSEDKKFYLKEYGISDDLYNYFFQKGLSILKENGVLAYITSDTYLSIDSKLNLRKLFLTNRILEIIRTKNVFENAMVSPAILIMYKKDTKNNDYKICFKDANADFLSPVVRYCNASIYRNVLNNTFFYPNESNLRIYNKYGRIVNELYRKWWDKIGTSKKIAKNAEELALYRQTLSAGDITLLGCLTDGGVGLQTGNNGKYIAVRKSTKWAKNIQLSRPKKLKEAIETYKIHELADIKDAQAYLNGMSEIEIARLFDNLKEKYGRDIFGQGYIYKIIDDNEIADVDSLSDEEKENGISPDKKYYVPYDKGDKDGNRWYLETPFAIAWTKENVGFCWSAVNTIFLKCRMKLKSINDVQSMALYPFKNSLPSYFFVCLINSTFISHYVNDFLNNTSIFQINDARKIPIKIPNENELKEAHQIFLRGVNITKKIQNKNIYDDTIMNEFKILQSDLDYFVLSLYS